MLGVKKGASPYAGSTRNHFTDTDPYRVHEVLRRVSAVNDQLYT